jgi:hypothetical protein
VIQNEGKLIRRKEDWRRELIVEPITTNRRGKVPVNFKPETAGLPKGVR